MRTFQHLPPPGFALALSAVLACSIPGGVIHAEPPATPAEVPSAPSGSFMSSLKQAFSQDFDHELVRGHFDVGAAPDTHRYYCLVDPKTGKSEANGVAGELVPRHDKMTGIKGASVSFFSCADAERKGLLVTAPYVLSASVASKLAPPPAPAVGTAAAPVAIAAAPAVAASAAAPAPASAPATAAAATPAVAPAVAPQTEVMALYTRFIAGQNAHDRAIVSEVLLDSNDFVLAQNGAASIWGRKEALDAFEAEWKGTWKVDPQTQELRIANIAPGVEMLITPLLFTHGAPGKSAVSAPQRWAGVFVKTKAGWRIAAIFITPYESWRAPKAD